MHGFFFALHVLFVLWGQKNGTREGRVPGKTDGCVGTGRGVRQKPHDAGNAGVPNQQGRELDRDGAEVRFELSIDLLFRS